ncbi:MULTISPECIES: hypothetical protein [unclassified Sedimentibacter]|uniref:hypothetical protein n=1 Tax=unclassified Sedimentibacter TaxID=2649220 RepID=UPI0027E1C8FF|nr:hypothetical protein [Sedimentibacter sp. MB35-C1]WMJ78480.1 hypothetical protein RBQ61_06045 [Sedimentibacter sp. MB35-C1]
MSKTWALRVELQKIFKVLTNNVFYEGNQDFNIYPRLVYELSEVSYNSGKTLFQLEVNVIDCGTSTQAVEELADNIQYTLNKCYFRNDKIQFTSYRGSRQNIKEDDKEIIRRRLLFEIHLHELKGE